VELVAALVLMSILGTFAISRFVGTDTFADYAARDLVVTAARLAQQRAMLDHSASACYRLSIQADRVGAQGFDGSDFQYVGPGDWQTGISLDDDVSIADTQVYFDSNGSVLAGGGCTGSAVAARSIPIAGASNLQVCLHSSGYVEGQDGGDACF
jgi:MSHA pilin protein MshC